MLNILLEGDIAAHRDGLAAGGNNCRDPKAPAPDLASVRDLMWRLVGVFRDGPGLTEAVRQLDGAWCWLRAQPAASTPAQVKLASVITVGRLMARAALRRELDRLWGTSTATWDLVVRHDIERSLPVQSAPLTARRPVALGEGLFVAGDHRDTASIQGALVSGERAARAVLIDRGIRED